MMPKTRRERQPFVDLLANPKIGKIAQNMKFEEAWSVVRLHQPVQNWEHDPMQASHIMDNRAGITGLKFQVYVQFGVPDYSSEIEPYLDADKTNANSFNTVLKLIELPGGKEKLMKYCAYDSIYEYRLSKLQTNDILPF
jgi:hypothetical protein